MRIGSERVTTNGFTKRHESQATERQKSGV
jgi:hypothetical protein